MARYDKTIFFIVGETPTSEEYKAAEAIGPGVVFRNASKIVPGAPLENCDAVAGAVPPDYKKFYKKGFEKNIHNRPNTTRTPASGGPDDFRPGTIDDGEQHQSGTASSPQNPFRQDQRAGRNVWEKNPERTAPDWPAATETGREQQGKAETPETGKEQQGGKAEAPKK